MAEHYSVAIVSRSEGGSAVGAVAYMCRSRIHDERTGLTCDFTSKGRAEHVECIGWHGTPEDLASSIEAREKRRDAQVARTWRIALPHELSDEACRTLARGHAEWLHAQYGMAVAIAIHAPPRIERAEADRRRQARGGKGSRRRDQGGDPRNKHLHLVGSTRAWDPVTGTWGARKIRQLDDLLTGPAHIENMRRDWAARASAALAEAGVHKSVDLRSIADRVRTGDLPPGARPQRHLGPRRAAVARARTARGEAHPAGSDAGRNAAISLHNAELMDCWGELEALTQERWRRQQEEREMEEKRLRQEEAELIAMLEARSRQIAEAERRAIRERQLDRLRAASTLAEAEAALEAATHLDVPDHDAWLAIWTARHTVPAQETAPADRGTPATDVASGERVRTPDAPADPNAADPGWPAGWQGGVYDPAWSRTFVCEPCDPDEDIEDLIGWPDSIRPPVVSWAPDAEEDQINALRWLDREPKPGSPEAKTMARLEARNRERREHERQVHAKWKRQVWPLIVWRARLLADPDPLLDRRYGKMTEAEQERVQELLVYHPGADPIEAVVRMREVQDAAVDLDDPDLDLVAAGWIDPQRKMPRHRPRREAPQRQRVRQLGD